MKIKKYFKILIFIISLAILCGCSDIEINKEEAKELRVYFINVGQADSIFAVLPNDETLLIDAGLDHATCFDNSVNFPSWDNIVKVLSHENITAIDHFIVTHYHSDHYYYAVDILKNYNVKNVYISGTSVNTTSYANFLSAAKVYAQMMYVVSVKDNIISDDDLTLQVVSTQRLDDPDDVNYTSVATKLTYNKNSFMFTGDMGYKDGDGEEIAIKSGIDLKSDVLKVGHHGSTYASGTEFLSYVRPTYAVFTTSSYTTTNHPHSASINRIKKYASVLLQSKTDGTIVFKSDGTNLNYSVHFGE